MIPKRLSHRTAYVILTGFFLALLSSCNSDRVFEESIKIEQAEWHADNILGFSAVISDTLCGYNMYIDVRNDISYSYSNLYLFMNTIFPDGTVTRDTIECMLAGYDGKWLGSGSGNVRFNRFLFQQNIQFPVAGSYRFEFEQAMRVEELKGILDVGIRIDKATN